MEYAVCAASSDSEDVTDSEEAATALEEEKVASNSDQQGPLFEVAAESTSDAPGSSGFAFINKAAPPRKSWDNFDKLKAGAGEKPSHKDIQNLSHFGKKDGSKVLVPGGVHSTTLAVNDLEDHTMQTIHKADEQELDTGKYRGETTEVKFHSSTSGQIDWAALAQAWIAQREATATEVDGQQTLVPNGQDIPPVEADISNHGNFQSDPNFNRMWQPEIGIYQKQNPRRSEVQWKSDLTGGQNQASNLVNRSEQPQKVQMPHARTGCGENAPFQTPCQWPESLQIRQLERRSEVQWKSNLTGGQNQASNLVKRSEQPQKVQMPLARTGCGESAPFQTPYQWSESFQTRQLERNYAAKEPINCVQSTELSSPYSQLVTRQEVQIAAVTKYKCSSCSMSFSNEGGLRTHIGVWHNVKQRFTCSKCNTILDSRHLLDWHSATAHNVFGRVTCLKCGKVYPNQLALENHQCTINVIKPLSSYFSNYSTIIP